MKFVIRRINPLIDFPSDNMPSIFTDTTSRQMDALSLNPDRVKKMKENMHQIIYAGVVEPELVPIGKGDKQGKEAGITSEDLFRDEEMGYKLYGAIIEHSLNHFKGLRKLFFSIKTKYKSYMIWRKHMLELRRKSYSPMAGVQNTNPNV